MCSQYASARLFEQLERCPVRRRVTKFPDTEGVIRIRCGESSERNAPLAVSAALGGAISGVGNGDRLEPIRDGDRKRATLSQGPNEGA